MYKDRPRFAAEANKPWVTFVIDIAVFVVLIALLLILFPFLVAWLATHLHAYVPAVPVLDWFGGFCVTTLTVLLGGAFHLTVGGSNS